MRRLKLNTFNQQNISEENTGQVKGGGEKGIYNSFCNWYMNASNGHPDPNTMAYYAMLDGKYQGHVTIYGTSQGYTVA